VSALRTLLALLMLVSVGACDRGTAPLPRVGIDAKVLLDAAVSAEQAADDLEGVHDADDSSSEDAGEIDAPTFDALEATVVDRGDVRVGRDGNGPPPWFNGTLTLPAPYAIPPLAESRDCFNTVAVMTPGVNPDSHAACLAGGWLYFSLGGYVGRARRNGSGAVVLLAGEDGIDGRVACNGDGDSFVITASDIYTGSIVVVEFPDATRPGIVRWQQLLRFPTPEGAFGGGFSAVTASDRMIAWVWVETDGPSHLVVAGPHGENPRDLGIPFRRPPHFLRASHDRLVFTSGGDIWLWTVGRDAPENLTQDDPEQWYPWIDGDRVVWVDQRDNPRGNMWSPDDPEIYAYDLRTRTRTRITNDTGRPALQYAPTVSGDWLVWMDYRNATDPNPSSYLADVKEIWGYNFRTRRTYTIQGWGRASLPLVDRERLYFNCERGPPLYVTRLMPPAD